MSSMHSLPACMSVPCAVLQDGFQRTEEADLEGIVVKPLDASYIFGYPKVVCSSPCKSSALYRSTDRTTLPACKQTLRT